MRDKGVKLSFEEFLEDSFHGNLETESAETGNPSRQNQSLSRRQNFQRTKLILQNERFCDIFENENWVFSLEKNVLYQFHEKITVSNGKNPTRTRV